MKIFGFELNFGESSDGKSSVWDKLESVAALAAMFVPQAAAVGAIVSVIDSIVDPDNKEEGATNLDVVGVTSILMKSVGNSISPEKLSLIAGVVGVTSDAITAFKPSNNKIAQILSDVEKVVDPVNDKEAISDDDAIGIITKMAISSKNDIDKSKLSTIISIIKG
jgi:hypothetical protein